MDKFEYYFGIDFGTTNSAASSIVKLGDGEKKIRYGDIYGDPFPSLLVVDRETGESFCGRKAWEKRRQLSQSSHVIHSVKSYLGTNKKWEVAGKEWTPEMVTAQIFRGLKEKVRKKHNIEMSKAIVSIPVAFPADKRKALRKAANMAQIEVVSFVSESTAAFIRNYNKVSKYSKFAVFDWGGGTLDVSVIEHRNGKIYELGIDSQRKGGDDIDLKLAKWVHSKIVRKTGTETGFEDMDTEFQDKMLVRCERAKKALADSDSTVVALHNYGKFGMIKEAVDIDSFSLLISNDVENAISHLENTVKSAGMSMEELECIIMVGGSSYLRPLTEVIKTRWSRQEIVFPDDADWSVAEGAAMLSRSPGSFKINQDIGVVLSDNSFYPLIRKGNELSTKFPDFRFGVVEETNDARFMFSDGTGSTNADHSSILGYLTVPVYGFNREQLILQIFVDKDFICHIRIKSDRRPSEYSRTWMYPKLRFYYELPYIVRRSYEQAKYNNNQ